MALTPILRLEKPDYNASGWDVPTNDNWDKIDAAFAQFVATANIRGFWENSTAYVVDNIVTDETTIVTYVSKVAHISAVSPATFADDRAANPTYWEALDTAQAYAYTARVAAVAAAASATAASTHATNAFTFATAASTSAGDAAAQAGSAASSAILAAQYSAAPMMNRNKMVNGSFFVWQTDVTFAADGFICDMWQADNITAVDQSSDAPVGFTYSCQVAGTTTPSIIHNIESSVALTLANDEAIFSIWLKNVIGSTALECVINIPDVIDDFTAVTQLGAVQIFAAPTGSWTRVQFLRLLPATATRGLQIVWRRAAGTTTTRYAGAQAETSVAGVATLNEYVLPSTEFLACQRYYQRINYSYVRNMAIAEVNLVTEQIPLMRTAPTLTVINTGSPVNVTSMIVDTISESAVTIAITATAAAATSVDNAVIEIDARLY